MSAASPESRFEAVRPRLLALLKRRFGASGPDADDAISVGLLAAWKGMGQVPPGVAEDGAIAYRRAFLAARRYLIRERQARSGIVSFEALEEEPAARIAGRAPDFAAALIDQLAARQCGDELWRRLTPHERQFIHWRYWDGRSLAEIATLAGCTISNVQGVINWGLNRYRRVHALPLFGPSPEKLRRRRAAPGPPVLPNRERSHCSHGHALTAPNLRLLPDGRGRCRACEKAACQAARARRKRGAPDAAAG